MFIGFGKNIMPSHRVRCTKLLKTDKETTKLKESLVLLTTDNINDFKYLSFC